MTIRKPLVIGDDGLWQQLQAGDAIASPTNAPSIRPVTNGDSVALTIGMPVYTSAADTVKRGQGNAKATSGIVGVIYDPTIAAGATGSVAESGTVIATTAQWDAVVTGQTGGLTFNSLYFLDTANPGKLTTTVPSGAGSGACNVLVGRAISTTELVVAIRDPILL